MNTPNTTDSDNQPDIGKLRERADQAAQLEAQNAQLQRSMNLMRAGVDTTTPMGELIAARLPEGEITAETVAGIRKELEASLGITTTQEPPAQEPASEPAPQTPAEPAQQNAAELANQAIRDQLGAGTPAPHEQAPGDLVERVLGARDEARKGGASRSDAMEAGVAALIQAAAEGHPDAVYDENQFAQLAAGHGHGAEFAGLPEAATRSTLERRGFLEPRR